MRPLLAAGAAQGQAGAYRERRAPAAGRAASRLRRAGQGVSGMKIYGFHLMPYQGLPADHLESTDSSWVTLSNAAFDPARGHALFQRYIGELIAYDRAGLDGVCVNEHHQSPYGLMPSPDVIAGIL